MLVKNAHYSQKRPHSVPTPWALAATDVVRSLNSELRGLASDEAERRLKTFGLNTLAHKRRLNALHIFVRQFSSPLVFILLAAAGLTTILGEWLDTLVILLAIAVNVGLGFYQEFRAENALENLSTYIVERARVIRDKIEMEVESISLVPGDIVRLSYGSRVPADLRLLEANGLLIDESILTGESLPVAKQINPLSEATSLPERTNMAFAGTLAIEGSGLGVVSATDAHTEIGHIAELVETTEREATPLQRALANLAWFIFAAVGIIVTGIFFLGLSRGESLIDMLLLASAIGVGAIPEALPIALTVILAIGVERLAKKKGVMRSLAAAETLGSATLILTDKTGTLTEADLRLTAIHTREELATKESAPETLGTLSEKERTILESALSGMAVTIENPEKPHHEWTFAGRPLEVGIVRAAKHHGIDVSHFLQPQPPPLLAFNSTNKFSIGRHHKEERFVVIGAPDVLLRRSVMSKDEFLQLETRVNDISAEGKRVLGIARMPLHAHHKLAKGAAHEGDATELEFLGVLVFKDPIRKNVRHALEKIEKLGAEVVMVTGDLKGTALSIAREIGWNIDEGAVLTGDDLKRLSDEELLQHLNRIRIFARVTPEDKQRIARAYKKLGHVVAMTGDGVNDAPTLKAVDIGVALGSGSDVAKDVADLVLLDNNFETIVEAVEEGRRMLGNMRKTFAYLLSDGLSEVFLIGGALLAGLTLPLNPLQIIWVNLFTGSLPALSFAFDSHVDQGRAKGGIFSREVKILTVGIGTLTSLLLFALYWGLHESGIPIEEARSILFLCFSSYVLVITYSFRSLRRPLLSYPVFSNTMLNGSVAIGMCLIVASVTVPVLRDLFEIAAPPLKLLWIPAAWLVLNVSIVEVAKWWFRSWRE